VADTPQTWQPRLAPRISAIVFGAVLVLALGLIGVQTALHCARCAADPFKPREETTQVVKTDGAGACRTPRLRSPLSARLTRPVIGPSRPRRP
jgi:hypothetical protein